MIKKAWIYLLHLIMEEHWEPEAWEKFATRRGMPAKMKWKEMKTALQPISCGVDIPLLALHVRCSLANGGSFSKPRLKQASEFECRFAKPFFSGLLYFIDWLLAEIHLGGHARQPGGWSSSVHRLDVSVPARGWLCRCTTQLRQACWAPGTSYVLRWDPD